MGDELVIKYLYWTLLCAKSAISTNEKYIGLNKRFIYLFIFIETSSSFFIIKYKKAFVMKIYFKYIFKKI